MFWAVSLKAGASHTLKDEEGALLHLSTACLHDPKDASKGSLQIKTEEGTFTLAVLDKERPMASFDLFFNTMAPPTFFNNSKNELHLTGYFEMNGEAEDDMMDDMSDVSEEEEESVPMKKIEGPKKAVSKAPASESEDEEDEDDEDDDEDDEEIASDMEGMSDLDDDEDDEEDEEDEAPAPVKAAPAKAAAKSAPTKAAPKAAASVLGKRSADAAAPAAKVQKTSADSYTQQVVQFLKTAGKTTVGMIGAKVKKPEDLPKLKQFLLTRKEFKISGDNIELSA